VLVALSGMDAVGVLHNISSTSSVGPSDEPLAARFALQGPRANPFRGGDTVIGFSLERDRVIELALYDVTGREVRRLAAGLRAAGDHEIRWDGRDETGRKVSPGIYFLRLSGGRDVLSRKLIISP
jgi:hypothetical protein